MRYKLCKFCENRARDTPLRGGKPQNWPLSKLNTGRFALRAMLPVMNESFELRHSAQNLVMYSASFRDAPIVFNLVNVYKKLVGLNVY